MPFESAIAPPTKEPALSETSRIVNTFTSPSKVFLDLRRAASWWAPWLILAVCSTGFVYCVDRNVGFEQVSRNMLANSIGTQQFEDLPPDQQAQRLRIASISTKYASYLSPMLILVNFLLIAAILMGVFNFGLGASVPFKVAFGIVAYGSLPRALSALLAAFSVLVSGMLGSLDRQTFNMRTPIAANIAYFMAPNRNTFLYGMANALDIFALWSVVLIGIGFACNSNVSRTRAIAAVGTSYFLYQLFVTGIGVLGG